MNKLAEVGARIVTSQEKLIHVSGHPGRDDLIQLYEKYNPTDIVPIHGESTFIRAHVEHVTKNFPSAIPHYFLNYDELIVNEDLSLKINQGEKHEPVLIHGKLIEIERDKISERRKLACNGSVFISLKIDKSLKDVEKFSITLQGLPNVVSKSEEKFRRFLENYFVQISFKDMEKTTEELRIATRKYFEQILGYKPQTFIHIL